MRPEPVDESLLVRYLLGNLTEEEQVRVEDQAFAEPDYLRAIEAAEADLIDDYVRGELTQADRRAFERHFLTSPQRRGKVEFARALARVTAEAPPLASASAPGYKWQALIESIRAWNPALRSTAAASVVLGIVGGSWLVFDNLSIRDRLSALEAERRHSDARDEGLVQQLTEAQKRADSLAAQMQKRSSSEQQGAPLVASLFLMAGPPRSEARVPQLVVGRGAQIAHIDIQLEAMDKYPRFRASVQTRSGRDVLVLSDLTPRRTGAGQIVSMDVPASVLGTGEYELALKGLSEGRGAEDIGYYYFSVKKL